MDQRKISTIIIDDELKAINLLVAFLRAFPEIEIVGKETDSIKGLELVRQDPPDLVFLDIDMPDMNGLTVADKIHTVNFHTEIVFTTAHQQYAYAALNVEPLDFLTKPFSLSDIKDVISKYLAKVEKKEYNKRLDSLLQSQNQPVKAKLPSTRGMFFIEVKDIVILKANLRFTDIIMSDGSKETIIRTLLKTAELIDSPSFIQISRSTLINLNYLHRVDKKGKRCLIYVNGSLVEEKISREIVNLLEKSAIYPFIIDE